MSAASFTLRPCRRMSPGWSNWSYAWLGLVLYSPHTASANNSTPRDCLLGASPQDSLGFNLDSCHSRLLFREVFHVNPVPVSVSERGPLPYAKRRLHVIVGVPLHAHETRCWCQRVLVRTYVCES
eukprot:6172243-Pleurochrysis_carterae.AAC.2